MSQEIVKVCKVHGGLTEYYCCKKKYKNTIYYSCKICYSIYKKNYDIKYYKDNKEKICKKSLENYKKNKDAINIKRKEYTKKTSETNILRATKWRKNNPKRHRENVRKKNKRNVDLLKDIYIKSILCNRSSLRFPDIPKEWVEAKKVQILIKRQLKEIKDVNNQHE